MLGIVGRALGIGLYVLVCVLACSACGDDDGSRDVPLSAPDAASDGGRQPIDASLPSDAADADTADAGPRTDASSDDAAAQDASLGDAGDAPLPDPGADAGTADEPCLQQSKSLCTLPPGATLCRELPRATPGTPCSVSSGSDAQLFVGDVLAASGMLRGGEVLVDASGTIQCVGCDCGDTATAADATRVVCSRGVISPGLINAHDHLGFTHNPPFTQTPERYEQRHDFRRGLRGHTPLSVSSGATDSQLRWGELRFVMGGATATLGEGGVAGFLRNLDDPALLEGLSAPAAQTETFPLDDFDGQQRDGDCDYGPSPDTAATISTHAFVAHVAEGIDSEARNEFLCLSSTSFDTVGPGVSDDLLTPHTAFVHGIALTAVDFARMAAAGTSLVWSPRSNLALYGDTARISLAMNLGVRIALGTDWMPTGSMNMLRELACAQEWTTWYSRDGITNAQALWRMATVNAAAVAGMDDRLGSLEPGFEADLAIFDGRPGHSGYWALIAAEPQDVVLVERGGRVLYGDAPLVSELPGGAGCELVGDVCGAQKRVCTLDDAGESYAALQTENAALYPLFFCDVPTDEPSCTPARVTAWDYPSGSVNGSDLYRGGASDANPDGDGVGVLNVFEDNCFDAFNPVRPQDEREQPDVDADGLGDVCDPCPFDPTTTTCSAFDPDDVDFDGVSNASDDCPYAPNASQLDTDADAKGDACDRCPNDSNPFGQACSVSMTAIKDGHVRPDTRVTLRSALVTAKAGNGFFVQLAPSDPGYVNADHSGLFVFTGSSTLDDAVVPGNRVELQATTALFQGQRELTSLTALSITSAAVEPLPEAVVVTTAEVTSGGTRATLPVDDYLYLVTPAPAVDDVFSVVRGVLALRSIGGGASVNKLLPRGASDLVPGP